MERNYFAVHVTALLLISVLNQKKLERLLTEGMW